MSGIGNLFGGGQAITPPVAQPVVKMADPRDPAEREKARLARDTKRRQDGEVGREETVLSQPPSYSNRNLGG